ncbi:MAG: hypothetical protein Q7R88_02775 [bacterium]|nr:hypothetical protein [bacterium]
MLFEQHFQEHRSKVFKKNRIRGRAQPTAVAGLVQLVGIDTLKLKSVMSGLGVEPRVFKLDFPREASMEFHLSSRLKASVAAVAPIVQFQIADGDASSCGVGYGYPVYSSEQHGFSLSATLYKNEFPADKLR